MITARSARSSVWPPLARSPRRRAEQSPRRFRDAPLLLARSDESRMTPDFPLVTLDSSLSPDHASHCLSGFLLGRLLLGRLFLGGWLFGGRLLDGCFLGRWLLRLRRRRQPKDRKSPRLNSSH